MQNKKEYEFHLTPFAGGAVETVRVMAQNRALGFSLAASQAADPNNVWKVRLIRDNGRVLDPDDFRESDVPSEFSSPHSYPLPSDDILLRSYDVYFDLFGGVQAREGVSVSGRINAFTAGVMESDAADAVREVWLDLVARSTGNPVDGGDYIDETKKYGGITVDLHDPVIPVPSGFMKCASKR